MSGIGVMEKDPYLSGLRVLYVSREELQRKGGLVRFDRHCFIFKYIIFQGSAPTISVDNTGGCQLYLSKDALNASVTTAKSSEINVLVPGQEPDGDWVCIRFAWNTLL